jgi:anaerobic magnesium-protoporphyrin IX monomethyl ester cyclase
VNHLPANPKVVLIRPDDSSTQKEFSLGLGYIAAALRRAGVELQIICCDIYQPEDLALLDLFRQSGARIFGIGAQYPSFLEVIRICRLIKLAVPGAVILLGGHLVSPIPVFVLEKTGADIACIGDADDVVVKVVRNILDGKALDGIPGTAFRRDGQFFYTPPDPVTRRLPRGEAYWPAWDLFPMQNYTMASSYYPFLPGDRVFSILTSRGCPYNCNFCYHSTNYRSRDLSDVFDEIEDLLHRYHLTGLYVEDDLFMVTPSRVMEFCEEMRRRRLRLKFTVTGRFDTVNREILAELKDVGCISVFYGGESGDQRILNGIGKGISVEQIREGVAMTREAGIFCRVGMMFGQPGETEESLARSVGLLKEIAYGLFEKRFLYGCVPFPGTRLYSHCLSEGLLRDHEDFFRRFCFQGRVLDQIPVNMTAIAHEPLVDFLRDANRELEAFYNETIDRRKGYF